MTADEPLRDSKNGYVARHDLFVGSELAAVLESEALPATGVDPERFWQGLSSLIHDLSPRNAELLEVRATLQAQIDRWHRERRRHAARCRGISRVPGRASATSFRLDQSSRSAPPMSIPRSRTIAGPQLVVPVTNARYALNAANARWGSLYDALYGTDALGDIAAAGSV